MSINDSMRFTSDNILPVSLETGDVCIAASFSEGEVDIRRNSGEGRVLVYDKDLNVKGALWTGEQGLVIGLEYCAQSLTLFVSDVSSQTVKRFSRDGNMMPAFPAMQGKDFGVIAAARNGDIVIGEHIKGDKFPFIGGGEIYQFGGDGMLRNHFAAEHDPGKFGFHGVTNLLLTAGDQSSDQTRDQKAVYISETGKRVMQYDLAAGCQMEDLFVLSDEDEKSTAGIAMTPDGDILMGTVYGACLFSQKGGLLKTYDIPKERGWSAVRVSRDGANFFVANFFTGRLEKRSLDTGQVIASADTGLVYRLASIAEIA
ncbi:MAG: hypothetical protein JKY45_00060 [Emcibacter sp.]|nr:hypothetical protein [Emcibacter sp.]